MKNKSYVIAQLQEEKLQLQAENDLLKMERQEMAASIAKLRRQLSESRMRHADLAERSSQGIQLI